MKTRTEKQRGMSVRCDLPGVLLVLRFDCPSTHSTTGGPDARRASLFCLHVLLSPPYVNMYRPILARYLVRADRLDMSTRGSTGNISISSNNACILGTKARRR